MVVGVVVVVVDVVVVVAVVVVVIVVVVVDEICVIFSCITALSLSVSFDFVLTSDTWSCVHVFPFSPSSVCVEI